jgi:aspartyl-tRNA synthetase
VKKAAGEVSSPAKKGLPPGQMDALVERSGLSDGDLLLIVADREKAALAALAALRAEAARELRLVDESRYAFCWVTEFPLLGFDEGSGQWFPMNHPFTAPREEDLDRLESDPGSVRARAYDVVVNGWELGSGSIRIHRADLQGRVFRRLGIGEDEARERFGFLLEALSYGAPPHGGIALGLDRICAIAAGATSLRDVIAFPKTTSGICLMTRAPANVFPEQLRELGLDPPRRSDG